MASSIEVSTKTLRELAESADLASPSDTLLELPSYQRGIVWNDQQVRDLIDSVYRGFPIGALLGFTKGWDPANPQAKKRRVQLVDGLQRTTAVRKYLAAPLYYAPIRQLFPLSVISVIRQEISMQGGRTITDDELYEAMARWAHDVRVPEQGRGFKSSAMANYVAGQVSVLEGVKVRVGDGLLPLKNEKDLDAALDSAGKALQRVESLPIPLIIYNGDESNVPEIFDRLNSGGIKLSKYERFAAAWIATRVSVNSADVRKAIEAKYDLLEAEGYELESNPHVSESDGNIYTLFEYLFGLGRVLAIEHPLLFPDPGPADENSPIAFVLATIAMGLRVSEMKDLPDALRRQSASAAVLEVDALEIAIRSACDDLTKSLRGFLSIRLNKTTGSRFIVHSQNQIISLIVWRMITTRSPATWELSAEKPPARPMIAVPAHYLHDIVRGSWAGSGDTLLFNRVWADEASSPGKSASKYYFTALPPEQLRSSLDAWHEDQLQKRQTTRAAVTSDAKLFLKFLYSPILSVLEDQNEIFELEHLYPVATLSALATSDGGQGWPISAIGNICLLPQEVNQIKGKRVLGEYLKSNPIEESQRRTLQRFVVAPEIEELVLPSCFDHAAYLDFCGQRFAAMREGVIKVLTSGGLK